MASNLLMIIFTALAVLGLVVFYYSLKKNDRVGRSISRFLISSDITLILYLIASSVSGSMVSRVLFSFFFCGNTIVTFFLFMFVMAFNKIETPAFFKRVIYILMGVDAVNMMANIFFSHAATIRFATARHFSGWVFDQQPAFYMHLLLCYLFIIGFFGCMIYRCIMVPRIYKLKYVLITLIAFLGLGSNLIFLYRKAVFDGVAVFYVVMGIILYLLTYVYLPRELGLKMGKTLLAHMKYAVFLFDMDGICTYYNKTAEIYIADKQNIGSFSEFADKFGFRTNISGEKQSLIKIENDSEIYYEIECHDMIDNKNRYEGNYVIIEDITSEQKELQKRIYQISHDSLTDVFNAEAFFDSASKLLEMQPKMEYSIITTNIKQFKIINDVMGRDIGDEMLKTIGAILKALPYKNIVYGRLESDKFALLAPSHYNIEKEFSANVSREFKRIGDNSELSIALMNYYGVYTIADRRMSIRDMCDMGQMAILSMKDDVTHNIAYYDMNMKESMIWESELISEIPDALKNEEFVIYYQPQIDSFTEKIVGAEALVRWEHPKHGLLSPGAFIPVLEKMGLIFDLDKYVWRHSAIHLKRLRDEGYNIAISVNISPRDIFAGDIKKIFSDLLAEFDLPPKSLRLEITETAASLDMGRFVSIITDLQSSGFTMEMDDFGSGYSSLNTLKDMPIDVLKMDMRFLDDSHDPVKSKKIIKTVSELANALDVALIAEGVERKTQVEFLAGIGCRNLQGYYYSKPVPYDSFKDLLDTYEIGELM